MRIYSEGITQSCDSDVNTKFLMRNFQDTTGDGKQGRGLHSSTFQLNLSRF
jgi:hypothetical protein